MSELYDEIAQAFRDSEQETEELLDPTTPDDTPEVARDEHGRFAKKDEPETEAEVPDGSGEPEGEKAATESEHKVEQPEEQGTWDHNKAPTSWSPKVRELWATLPEEVRREVVRREEASVNGVRKLQEEFAPVRQFTQSLAPFLQEYQQLGTHPAQHVHNVLAAERALRSGDINSKMEALLGIADQYGIPLRQAINSAAGTELVPTKPAIPAEVQRELEESRRFRESFQQQTVQQTIQSFGKTHEFFEDVRGTMADMLDAGVASDMEDAYEKATWAHPEVRAVLLQRQQAGKQQEELKSRQSAAAAATVKSSGKAELDIDDDADDSMEATIRRAFRQSGRV